MKILDGWIFDVYLAGRDMVVWVIDRDGQAHGLRDRFVPSFYVGGEAKELRAVAQFLIQQRWDLRLSRAERTELFLGHPMVVLKVDVLNPNLIATIFQRVTNFKPALNYYDGDISLPQLYFFARQAFPLAFCHIAIEEENRICGITVDDSPWALDYALPPLKRSHTQHEEYRHIPYPVKFIVKPDGTVAWRFLGLKPLDRPKVEDVVHMLDAIMVNAQ